MLILGKTAEICSTYRVFVKDIRRPTSRVAVYVDIGHSIQERGLPKIELTPFSQIDKLSGF
jgi:hypothetical protein